jgi:hypothetical protein
LALTPYLPVHSLGVPSLPIPMRVGAYRQYKVVGVLVNLKVMSKNFYMEKALT